MLDLKRLLFISIFTSSVLIANENQSTKLGDITVSANKMEENIQDVPQSISVITEEDIEQKGIDNVIDIIKQIPNMNYNNFSGGTMTQFRGLNTSQITYNNPVVIYVDGVPYYDRYDFNPSLADVEQVEVLRGPQGTLYGKDAIGAVINIKTKTPTNEWKGTFQAEYGNDNTFDTKFNASGAIIDNKLFAGINNTYYHTDGWIENHYQGSDKHANKKNDRKTSGFLLYKPTNEFSAKLTVVNNYENKNFIDGLVVDDTLKPINSFKRKDAKNVNFEVPTFEKTKVNSQALNLTYETEKVKFDSITTHKKLDYDGRYDTDYIAYNGLYDGLEKFNYLDTDTWTQELKLSSKNQDIKWVAGLYFDKEDRKQGPYGSEMVSLGGVYYSNSNSDTDTKTQAIFGQVMIPFLEDFELALGGRYQRIEREISSNVQSSLTGTPFDFSDAFSYNDDKTWNSFLPKVALSYKINDNLSTYASFSKGYMPGGFNYFPLSNVSKNNTFEAQKSTNYEVGAKYIGDDFALNASIFRMDIKDTHVYKIVGIDFITDNAEKAHSQGIELDGIYFLSDNWSISGAIGFIDAEYDDYDSGTRNYNGKRMESTPRYTANLGLAYLPSSGVYGRVDLQARGKTNYMDSANNSMVEADGAIITNAKIGYKFKDFDIYAYGKNLTNEEYVTSYTSIPNLVGMAGLNDPRQYGIGMIYKF